MIISQLKRGRKVLHPLIGMGIANTIDRREAKVVVTHVEVGSPADSAGVQKYNNTLL